MNAVGSAQREAVAPLGIGLLVAAAGFGTSGPFGVAPMAAARERLALNRAAVIAALGRTGTVRPVWLSKVLGWSLATAPRAWRTRIMGQVMRRTARPGAVADGGRARPERAGG